MTPGAKTSEFAAVLVAAITAIVAALQSPSVAVQCTAIGSLTLITCTYMAARALVKARKAE